MEARWSTTTVMTIGTGCLLMAMSVSWLVKLPASGRHDEANQQGKTAETAPATSSSVHHPTEGAQQSRRTVQDDMMRNHGALLVQSIGTIRSIYRLCVGTPRQGLLAPHARGCIVLDHLPDAWDAVDGLNQYSHVWVVFVFHLNTVGKRDPTQTSPDYNSPHCATSDSAETTDKAHHKRRATSTPKKSRKIAPPALGGQKVGVLATRSPHRFNPIGITLVKLDRIRPRSENTSRNNTVILDVSGVDLVDGTPVLDVKPFVGSYDSPISASDYRIPTWVSDGLKTQRNVEFEPTAYQQLQELVASNVLEFYGAALGETNEEGFRNALSCIREVLAMDVRSPYQTKKVREGKSQAERARRIQEDRQPLQGNAETPQEFNRGESKSRLCTQQIDNILVHFKVAEASNVQRESSYGSGAEDNVLVTHFQILSSKEIINCR